MSLCSMTTPEVLTKNFQFYNAERLGQLPASNDISWRSNSLLYEIGPAGLGFGNVTGGWMGGGNAGTVKNTIPYSNVCLHAGLGSAWNSHRCVLNSFLDFWFIYCKRS